jgi:hypothetical protein
MFKSLYLLTGFFTMSLINPAEAQSQPPRVTITQRFDGAHVKNVSKVVEDVLVRVVLSKIESSSTQRFPITISLTNVTNANLVIPQPNGLPDCRLSVLDGTGVPCSRSKKGDELLSRGAMSLVQTIPRVLSPNETVEWTIDLAELFHLQAVGYSVKFEMDIHDLRDVSNGVRRTQKIALTHKLVTLSP